jgi:LAO/AO transport system kinase
MATRGATGGLARTSAALSHLFRSAGFDFVIVETVGVGQDEIDVAGLADVTVVVLVPGMGDDIQAIKAGVMEIADVFVINKADRPGAEQTQREIEAMLSLGHGQTIPAIFRTAAIEGTGIVELLNDLENRKPRPRDNTIQYWEIDHLGIAVRSLDEALPFYAADLGLPVLSRETVEHEKVNVAMLPAGTSRIELLEPLDPTSTIAKFLEKRGPGLHHIAMRVPDLHATARRLEAAGVRLLGTPRRGAGGHLYVFVHPASTGGVLWELIQN